MKLSNLFSVILLAVSSVTAKQVPEISVYELNRVDTTIGHTIDKDDAMVYFSDRLGISEFYELGGNQDLIKFIDERNSKVEESISGKAKLFVMVKGVKESEELFENVPSFKISDKDMKLVHELNSKIPKQISASKDLELNSLSEELKLVSNKNGNNKKLVNHFKYFNEQLLSIWQGFKSKVSKSNNPNQVVFNEKKVEDASILNVINDKLFINEFSQLIHLLGVDAQNDDHFFFDSNSLLSIGKKIGYDSKTYQFSRKLFSTYLQVLANKFDVTVLSFPEGSTKNLYQGLRKRNLSLEKLFESTDTNKRSGFTCYSSEDACKAGTSSCSGHGSCTSNNANCWSCACSSSYDDSRAKTTYWTGSDCSKKDISSEANLFLWSGLAMLVLFVGGIQLLIKVGNEPIPGVLDAATIPKKNV